MPLSVAQILASTTEQQALDGMLATLRGLGFRTTSWQDGSVQKTLLRAVARSYAGASNVLAQTLDALLVRPAGAWQDVRGTYWFGLPRLEAVQAIRDTTWTSAPSAPPHVIARGSIITTAEGVRYETLGPALGTSLGTGATVTIEVRALEAGTGGNVAEGTALSLVTPYAGVTVAFDGEPTTLGAPRETDARYQERLDRRWSEVTYSVGLRAYELWALTADASIARTVAWNNYPNENDVRVTIDEGTVGQVANVEAYIAGRSPPNDVVTVTAAVERVIAVVATPRIRVGTTTVDELQDAWQAYADALPIGGTRVAGATAGRFLREGLTRVALCQLSGVESVGLVTPAADVLLARDEIVRLTFTVTPEWIP